MAIIVEQVVEDCNSTSAEVYPAKEEEGPVEGEFPDIYGEV
jgi:hypothetical protein